METQETLRKVFEFCEKNDLPARVVGKWVWLSFEKAKPTRIPAGVLAVFYRACGRGSLRTGSPFGRNR